MCLKTSKSLASLHRDIFRAVRDETVECIRRLAGGRNSAQGSLAIVRSGEADGGADEERKLGPDTASCGDYPSRDGSRSLPLIPRWGHAATPGNGTTAPSHQPNEWALASNPPSFSWSIIAAATWPVPRAAATALAGSPAGVGSARSPGNPGWRGRSRWPFSSRLCEPSRSRNPPGASGEGNGRWLAPGSPSTPRPIRRGDSRSCAPPLARCIPTREEAHALSLPASTAHTRDAL